MSKIRKKKGCNLRELTDIQKNSRGVMQPLSASYGKANLDCDTWFQLMYHQLQKYIILKACTDTTWFIQFFILCVSSTKPP